MTSKANLLAIIVLLLFVGTELCAQIAIKDRLEFEGGINLTAGVRSLERYADTTATTIGRVGYQFGINAHVWQMYYGNGLRTSFTIGFNYGSTRFRIKDLSYDDRGSALTGSSITFGPIRNTLVQVDASSQSLRTQFQLRHEVSKNWAGMIGLQRLDIRGGRVVRNVQITNSHFYDQTRTIFVPLDEPDIIEEQNVSQATSAIRLQLGAEYRGWFPGGFAKLLLEFGGPNNGYEYATTHLSLLVGYRL